MSAVAASLRSFSESLKFPVSDWEKPLEERVLGDGKSMLIMAALYLVSLSFLKAKFYGIKNTEAIRLISTVNNWVMCLYSLYTFVGVATLMVANFIDQVDYSVMKAVCDPEYKMMNGMDYWVFHFYLSKFWEWIDTWILLLKGKPVWPPSNNQFFLHVFHHCTTASIAWVGLNGEVSFGYLAALTNSFVHIPMYLYYGITEHWAGARNFGVFITPIQIIQFIIMICAMLPSVFSPSACGASVRGVGWWAFTYSVFLYFFVQMFMQKKARRNKSLAEKKAQ